MCPGRVESFSASLFGLDDVGNALLACDLHPELYQRPQADGPQCRVPLRRCPYPV